MEMAIALLHQMTRQQCAQTVRCAVQIPQSSGAIEVIYQRASNKRRRQGELAGGPRKRTAAPAWPGGLLNKQLRFVLHKENLDTQVGWCS